MGPVKFVRYNREFIITGVIFVLYIGFGTKKSVRYNRRFVITEFVITEFHCIKKYAIGQNEFEQSFKVQAKEANFWGGKKLIFSQTSKKADPTNFCLIVVEIKCSQLAVNFRNVSLLIIWNSGGSISTAQWFFFCFKMNCNFWGKINFMINFLHGRYINNVSFN